MGVKRCCLSFQSEVCVGDAEVGEGVVQDFLASGVEIYINAMNYSVSCIPLVRGAQGDLVIQGVQISRKHAFSKRRFVVVVTTVVSIVNGMTIQEVGGFRFREAGPESAGRFVLDSDEDVGHVGCLR